MEMTQQCIEEISYKDLQKYRYNDENLRTRTSIDQTECEESCELYYYPFECLPLEQQMELQTLHLVNEELQPCLLREKHKTFLRRGLSHLSSSYVVLDASRPWLCYWMLHGLDLLGSELKEYHDKIIETLRAFWQSSGGFGGGYMQLGHTATTYASCLTLAIIATPAALDSVDLRQLYNFFMRRKHSTGAFSAHEGGEVDVRVTYCVISIASLYGLLTEDLISGVVEYVVSCQTYEGGFGGEPFTEAHGGYTFCSIATLWILQALDRIKNMNTLLHWISHRQMRFEGGYQGRTNKLVDGCYSFWQGAIPALLAPYLQNRYGVKQFLCHQIQLQKYILLCGQQIEGGLRDKPGKPRDHYHSCYCLSGLSIAQHGNVLGNCGKDPTVYGSSENMLEPIHPAYNIALKKVAFVKEYLEKRSKGIGIKQYFDC